MTQNAIIESLVIRNIDSNNIVILRLSGQSVLSPAHEKLNSPQKGLVREHGVTSKGFGFIERDIIMSVSTMGLNLTGEPVGAAPSMSASSNFALINSCALPPLADSILSLTYFSSFRVQ